MELPKRKHLRLNHFDYSQSGWYFITICTEHRKCLLGSVVGCGVLDAPYVALSAQGEIVRNILLDMDATYDDSSIDAYVIMPNHIHFILHVHSASEGAIHDDSAHGTSRTPSPTNAKLPLLISTFKRFANKQIGASIWQRSYYERVIRDEPSYRNICKYIETNPQTWHEDCYYANIML